MTSLHGPQDRRKKANKPDTKRRNSPMIWRKRGLTRVNRVLAFLESLPITKGIYAGKKMKLLPGQRAFVKAFESLSADAKRADGLSPSFWIYDEFAQAPNTDLLDNLRTAMGKRNESLGVIISTQAANDQHPLSQMIDDAALGQDKSVYLQLASAPTDADIFDEKTWFACNEALGK